MDHLHDPEFIKTASVSEAAFFAYHDGVSNFFPIDTPENTLLSAEYFEKNASLISDKAAVPQIADAIVGALTLHGVTYTPMEKVAEEEDDLLKIGAEIVNFDQKHKSIPVTDRVSHARKLMDLIQQLKNRGHANIHVPPSVHHYGGDHFDEHWKEHVDTRRRFAPHEARPAYDSVIEEGASQPASVIARLLDHLDHKFGMHTMWNKKFPDPYYGTLSSTPPKKVTIIIMSCGGKTYTEDDLAGIGPEHLAGHFSDDVVDRIFSDRSRWNDMPDAIKQLLVKGVSV